MKCNFCEEQLEKIGITHGFPPVTLSISKEQANLYVCTSRDCKNCGAVIVIPQESKDID